LEKNKCSKSLLFSIQFREKSNAKLFVVPTSTFRYISEKKNETSNKHNHRDTFISNTKYYAPNQKAFSSSDTTKKNITDSIKNVIKLFKANMILELVVL